MITVEDTLTIDAPREDVFEFLDDPHNHAAVTPSLEDVKNIEPLDNGGKRLDFTYTIGGLGFEGELEETEHAPPEVLQFDMRGRLEGEIRIILEEIDDETTKATYAADYDLPGQVIEKLAEPFVHRYNEREQRSTLENIKTRLELSSPVA